MHKKNIAAVLLLISLFIAGHAFADDENGMEFKKEPSIQQVKPKKPVKIKLKRSAEGKYSWELSGDDVDEVVRVDRRLKRLLKIE